MFMGFGLWEYLALWGVGLGGPLVYYWMASDGTGGCPGSTTGGADDCYINP